MREKEISTTTDFAMATTTVDTPSPSSFVVQRSFLFKTRRGKLVKVVREHYLRDDLGCGFDDCGNPECAGGEADLPEKSPCPGLVKSKHVVVADASVVVGQTDAFEALAKVTPVILLQSVAEEARKRSGPAYRRARDAGAVVFVNEHHRETYAKKQPGRCKALNAFDLWPTTIV